MFAGGKENSPALISRLSSKSLRREMIPASPNRGG
jgi:hypothetical protein